MTANPIAEYPMTGGSATLPPATGAGQVLTSTGAGTTYTAQAPTFQLIQKITATAVASLTFSAIPQTFINLKLVGNFSITSGTNLVVTFNGDVTSGHYNYQLSYGNDTVPGATFSASAASILVGTPNGAISIDIPLYAAASQGVALSGTFSSRTAAFAGVLGANWTGTDITSITLADANGTALFVAGSVFSLYGY